ncbi:MAG: endolytic transglycosylase MltG, partial [Desulfotomaculaceae bacterium]|nr:endolytic transglycosylase MltG [Desulfotomaculaceae bacterium]
PEGEKRLEGYLFPDTYSFNIGESESIIVETMLKRFDREMAELGFEALAEENGISLHQAVTIASLVEREAKADEERPLIAGVIYNRLNISMPLQIDATIQYALGENKPEIYYKDLEVDSPYNTYRNYGLPPGPIAMPGRASLLAAVNPADTDYLYYVAKPDGSHAFATTLAQHNVNKEMYQQ